MQAPVRVVESKFRGIALWPGANSHRASRQNAIRTSCPFDKAYGRDQPINAGSVQRKPANSIRKRREPPSGPARHHDACSQHNHRADDGAPAQRRYHICGTGPACALHLMRKLAGQQSYGLPAIVQIHPVDHDIGSRDLALVVFDVRPEQKQGHFKSSFEDA